HSYSFGTPAPNTGLEGVTYDPAENAMWGIKETTPLSIFRMTGVPRISGDPNSTPAVTEPIVRRTITRWGNDPLLIVQASDIYALSACPAFSSDASRRM